MEDSPYAGKYVEYNTNNPNDDGREILFNIFGRDNLSTPFIGKSAEDMLRHLYEKYGGYAPDRFAGSFTCFIMNGVKTVQGRWVIK